MFLNIIANTKYLLNITQDNENQNFYMGLIKD